MYAGANGLGLTLVKRFLQLNATVIVFDKAELEFNSELLLQQKNNGKLFYFRLNLENENEIQQFSEMVAYKVK